MTRRRGSNPFSIEWNDTTRVAPLPLVRQAITRAVAHLPAHRLENVSVAIVNATEMGRLHRQHTGDPSPTDVLSFELTHDAGGKVTSGEIIVCLTVAKKMAKSMGHSPVKELTLYVLHGLLHLCGLDDHDEASYRKMHAAEDRILSKIGVGRVFAR